VGLEPRQAENAIREPALIDDQRLRSRRFAYTEDAARTLLEFLRTKKERDERVLTPTVDPSQLQIICQHLERSILPKKQQTADPEAIVEISLEDLGGEEGLNEILRDFYRREIEDFGSEDQALIRKLCEIGLISRSGRRLSLEEGEIQADFGVSSDLLDDLVDRRILRAEPRVGSVYYELAHDTLVAPILVYRGERVDKEREAAENLARGSRLDRWAFRLGLANLFLFGYIGGITAALSLLARRSPPMPRKGQWKARVALVISYFWMGIYTAILVFESDDPGLGLLFYLGIVLQTAIGTLVGIVWPVHGKRTRRSALVTIAGGLALAFTLLGLWGLFANYVSPDGALRIDRTSPAGSLSIGACFDDSAVAEIQDVDLLDCNEPHDYEIYAMVQLEGNEGAYPGDQSLFDELDQYCFDQFEAYVGRDYSSSKYFYTPFGPLEPEWARGDRGGICLLSLGIAKNTSSAFNSGQ
ncbi:MAG: septum formation family protein, partial [Actinobacteria bacterium]|nr:septum formation family protein [Actinomycetota bacterium]